MYGDRSLHDVGLEVGSALCFPGAFRIPFYRARLPFQQSRIKIEVR